MARKKKITVIGGGITGLSAAFYLHQELQSRGVEAEIHLSEATDRFGGKIQTMERDGFIFEKGPDSFLSRKVWILDLVKELGIEHELTGTNPAKKRNYILHHNRLYQMPEGMVMGIPSKIKPFITTDLISLPGKLRAMLDFFLPAHKGNADESLGHFMERRLGKEVLYKIAEPLLSGIYAGDTHRLSIQATFPQFAEMEKKHGSLIRATMKSSAKQGANLPGKSGTATKSVFMTFKHGLQTLVNTLITTLEQKGVILHKNRPLTSIVKKTDGTGYILTYNGSEQEECDAVILTLPTRHAAQVLKDHAVADKLLDIEFVSVANIVLAYNRDEINHPLDGSGFVVPRTENRFITACTWTSEKWLHTTSPDHVLIRCYVGRAGAEAWMQMNDEEIITRVRQDIKETMGIEATPIFTEVTKLFESMPQYDVGHLQRVEQIRTELQATMPDVWITGAAFHGVGLPDCIRQGKETAIAVVDRLTK